MPEVHPQLRVYTRRSGRVGPRADDACREVGVTDDPQLPVIRRCLTPGRVKYNVPDWAVWSSRRRAWEAKRPWAWARRRVIDAGAGDDLVLAGGGNDTLRGGDVLTGDVGR